MTTRIRPRSADRVPSFVLFLVSGFTQYYGAALAVGLFSVLPSALVAWWRLALSAVVLLAWQRPWRRTWSRADLLGAAGFGVVLATMNVLFYLALSHLPLGTAVAIEFLGPVVVAAVGGQGWRERIGILLAAAGVVALAGVSLEGGLRSGTVLGLLAVLGAAASWAFYIVLGRRVANNAHGLTALTVGMTAGALLYSPLAVGMAGRPALSWGHWLALAGIAVFSSVIPYGIEQLVLRRVTAARFAILLALLPVAAMLMGLLVLHQVPHLLELVGVAAICAAIVLSARSAAGAPDGESVS